jgi:hypothetical protein
MLFDFLLLLTIAKSINYAYEDFAEEGLGLRVTTGVLKEVIPSQLND